MKHRQAEVAAYEANLEHGTSRYLRTHGDLLMYRGRNGWNIDVSATASSTGNRWKRTTWVRCSRIGGGERV